jgi:hypothetical protein
VWDLVAGWTFLWIGVAWHQSFIVFLPLFLLLAWRNRNLAGGRTWLQPSVLAATVAAPLLLVGIYESWSIARFGWAAKVQANPVTTYATGEAFGFKFLQNVLSTFVGDQALRRIYVAWRAVAAEGGGASKMVEAIYVCLVSGVSWGSGTVLGVGLPLWWAMRRGGGAFTGLGRAVRANREVAAGLAIAGVATLVLLQGVSHWGLLQAGFQPFVLLGFWFAAQRVTTPGTLQRICLWESLTGLLPYLLLNLFLAALLGPAWPEVRGLGERLRQSDGDLIALWSMRESTFALAGFPWVTILSLTTAVAMAWATSLGGRGSARWRERWRRAFYGK